MMIGSLASFSSRAELLSFKAGGQIQAPATIEGKRVRIETPIGAFRFKEQDFVKIVPGGVPEREWNARRRAALNTGEDALLETATWALENGLVDEAGSMLRQAKDSNRRDAAESRMIAALEDLDRGCQSADPDIEPLRTALGVRCQVEQSAHVLLLHQHEPAEARERVELLERIVTAYYLTMAPLGLDLNAPHRRIVSVHLKERKDYIAFLQAQHAGAFRNTTGYYHPTFRAVVTCDAQTISRRDEDSDLDDPILRDQRRARLLRLMDERAKSLGTAAHELIHLLVAESGLSRRPADFPHWLHEGLASQFEVVRGGRWAGVGQEHDLRLPDWRAAATASKLGSLIRDAEFGHGYQRDLYARCWALVYYLRKGRPEEFQAYLDLLRLPYDDAISTSRIRHEKLFQSAFGSDIAALEREWKASMSGLHTPLEQSIAETWTRTVLFVAPLD